MNVPDRRAAPTRRAPAGSAPTRPPRCSMSNCKAHELDNLYVVDTSFFPSIGAVNPALTAMANAIRVGEHLAGSGWDSPLRVRCVMARWETIVRGHGRDSVRPGYLKAWPIASGARAARGAPAAGGRQLVRRGSARPLPALPRPHPPLRRVGGAEPPTSVLCARTWPPCAPRCQQPGPHPASPRARRTRSRSDLADVKDEADRFDNERQGRWQSQTADLKAALDKLRTATSALRRQPQRQHGSGVCRPRSAGSPAPPASCSPRRAPTARPPRRRPAPEVRTLEERPWSAIRTSVITD